MLKQILAVVIGFVLWSFCWLAYNIVLKKVALLPADQSQPIHAMAELLTLLFGSFVISIVSGYVAAWIGPAASNLVVLILGLLLLAAGVFFQMRLLGFV